MLWIYLSPHPDDVALSCGGLVWEQTQNGDRVEIWTICAADPPARDFSPFAESLHQRWGASAAESAARRRVEDQESARVLGARLCFFDLPDCIYRRGGIPPTHLYASEESLFGPLHPYEQSRVEELGEELQDRVEHTCAQNKQPAHLVCPLTSGNHVDHQLVKAAAEHIISSCLMQPLCYYADYPYIIKDDGIKAKLRSQGWKEITYPVSEAGLAAWQGAVAAYQTQISSFWTNLNDMRTALRSYRDLAGGVQLWHPG